MTRTSLKLTVEYNGRIEHAVEIEKADALDAIDWLKSNNGHAPITVHLLIRSLEVACRLAKPVEVAS